jgi:hypothetical protein
MDNQKVLTSEITDRVVTVDKLLTIYDIDLETWEIEKKIINTWEVGAKGPDGKITTTPLFQVKVWLKKKQAAYDLQRVRQEFIEDLKTLSPKIPRVVKPTQLTKDGKLLEITVFDLHFGKVSWHQETGENYNIEIASQRFNDCIDYFIDLYKDIPLAKILLPISNDFFNSDRSHPFNSTTSGTPQEEDTRWQNTFRKGRELLIANIQKLTQLAPVEVAVIPGNHDYERSFYLGDSLEGWFHNNQNVTINNSPSPRKYFTFGKNLIGLTHGNNEKLTDLPMIMAQENPVDWAMTYYREFHLGHLHHKKEGRFNATNELQGVMVRHMSSLSGTDSWHHKKGYIGARKSAEAFLWDSERGLLNQAYYNI